MQILHLIKDLRLEYINNSQEFSNKKTNNLIRIRKNSLIEICAKEKKYIYILNKPTKKRINHQGISNYRPEHGTIRPTGRVKRKDLTSLGVGKDVEELKLSFAACKNVKWANSRLLE